MLKQELGVEATLEQGRGGIFEVSVGDRVVARKSLEGFPSEAECLDAVRAALNASRT